MFASVILYALNVGLYALGKYTRILAYFIMRILRFFGDNFYIHLIN